MIFVGIVEKMNPREPKVSTVFTACWADASPPRQFWLFDNYLGLSASSLASADVSQTCVPMISTESMLCRVDCRARFQMFQQITNLDVLQWQGYPAQVKRLSSPISYSDKAIQPNILQGFPAHTGPADSFFFAELFQRLVGPALRINPSQPLPCTGKWRQDGLISGQLLCFPSLCRLKKLMCFCTWKLRMVIFQVCRQHRRCHALGNSNGNLQDWT